MECEGNEGEEDNGEEDRATGRYIIHLENVMSAECVRECESIGTEHVLELWSEAAWRESLDAVQRLVAAHAAAL
jgi:DNA-binding transcriptional regulator/RsmH inhibitor MraZ